MQKSKPGTIVLKIVLFCVLIYFPLFMHLGELVVRLWDESRQSVNAFEMYNGGSWLVTSFEGQPDMWNTKPPLLIWLQTLFMHLVGPKELALRLPSALAALAASSAILVLFSKHFRQYWSGLLAVIILISSSGYVGNHGTRTGDYDALLGAFELFYALTFFLYLINDSKNNKYLYLTFFFITCAVYTKGIAGLFFVPGLIVFALLEGRLMSLLKNRHTYIGAISAFAAVAAYYVLREKYNPGYWDAVKMNELGGRFLNTIENHDHEFMFYINNLIDYRFNDWHWFVIPGIVAGLLMKDFRKLTLLLLSVSIPFLLILSTAKTKLAWYDVPIYPILSILAAFTFIFIFRKMVSVGKTNTKKKTITVITLIVILLLPFVQYKKIIKDVYKPVEKEWEWEYYQITYYLRQQLKESANLNNYIICYDDFHHHILFYTGIFSERNQKISLLDYKLLKKGDHVIAHRPLVKEYIEQHYAFDVIDEHNRTVKVYLIK